jgi:hypothetical protein
MLNFSHNVQRNLAPRHLLNRCPSYRQLIYATSECSDTCSGQSLGRRRPRWQQARETAGTRGSLCDQLCHIFNSLLTMMSTPARLSTPSPHTFHSTTRVSFPSLFTYTFSLINPPSRPPTDPIRPYPPHRIHSPSPTSFTPPLGSNNYSYFCFLLPCGTGSFY